MISKAALTIEKNAFLVGRRYELTSKTVEGHLESISSMRQSPKMDGLHACRFSSESSRLMNRSHGIENFCFKAKGASLPLSS